MRLLLLFTSLIQLVVASSAAAASPPFGTFCLGILGNVYQFKTQNCTVTNYKKASCYCVDPRFVETAVSCVEQYLLNVTQSKRSALRNSSYKTITSTCKKVKINDLMKLTNNVTSLPVYDGSKSGLPPGQWPAPKTAFRLTQKELSDALITWKKQTTNGKKNKRYGSALLGFWAGVFLIKGVLHFGGKIFPQFFHRVGNTQIGRFYRRYFQIYCPRYSLITTSQFFLVVGFIALLSCVTFLDLPYHFPNYNYQYKNMPAYSAFLGSRTGVLALYILPLFMVFAGRNNFLQWLTGWNQEPFLVFHRWVARGEVALIVAHAIAYSLVFGGTNRYKQLWSKAYWNWGVVSLAFGMLIFVQAVRFLRRFAYETFLVVHIIGAIFYIVGAYYHIKFMQEYEDYNFFYATFAVWGFDRLVRLIRIGVAGMHECTMVLEDENMLVCTMNKPKWWPAASAPGSYVFVHFMMPLTFWQSHPLTLTASASDPNKIKLYFRVYSGISKTLAKRAVEAGTEGIKMKVLLDGPYGIAYDLDEYEECVFIAGGSGITAPLAYLQNFKSQGGKKLPNTVLHWAVRDEAALYWFREELEYLQNELDCDVHVYVSNYGSAKSVTSSKSSQKTESNSEDDDRSEPEKRAIVSTSSIPSSPKEFSYNVHRRRLEIGSVLQNQIVNASGSMGVLCCGPTGLHVDTRNTICRNINKTPHYIQYYEESYSW